MKTFRFTSFAILLTGILFAVVTFLYAQDRPTKSGGKGKVEIMDKGIILHPTVKLSPGDEETLNNILKQFDKNLYKVETLDHGKVKKTRGTLSDAALGKAIKAEMAEAKARGASVEDVVFVVPVSVARHWSAKSESKELIDKVKPVVQKYD